MFPGEWILYGKPWSEWENNRLVNRFEAKPGMQIEVRHDRDGRLERYLVGEIEEQGGQGVADDIAIWSHDIVVRYRWLIDPKWLEMD